MTISISETRNRECPIPFVDAPVGFLEFDGHEVIVWSIATTVEGKVIFLNCSAADASLSATLKRLLRKSGGKATFLPAKGVRWVGPHELGKLPEPYMTVTQALTHHGMRLKNQCVIPNSLNIAAGLSRPMETTSSVSDASSFEAEEQREGHEDGQEMEEVGEGKEEGGQSERTPEIHTFRYVIGDVGTARPPTGALFAQLQSLVVVCHSAWEGALWEQGLAHRLILPQPALGLCAWSITGDRGRWTDLIGELWLRGALSRPEPVSLLTTSMRPARSHKHPPVTK